MAQDLSAPLLLVVDDDPMVRALITQNLKKERYRVVEADGAEAALAIFSRQRPDLVLLDLVMPDTDGFQACAEIRKLPGGTHVPIAVLTALDDKQSIRLAYQAGATDFIIKPINWELLAHRVRYLLRAGQAFQDLARSQARLARAQRIAQLGHWDWDVERGSVIWSDELWRILGLEPQPGGLTLGSILDYVHPEDRKFARQAFIDALKTGKAFDITLRMRTADGGERTVISHGLARLDPDTGRTVYMQGTMQDITERRRIEERIRHLAYYDSVTTLPNRVLFKEQLANGLMRAKRNGRMLAVMFVDLDQFKRINDSMGHMAGDELLRIVAARLSTCVRGDDALARGKDELSATVARQGGDEFTIMLTDISDANGAAIVARRILDELALPINLQGRELTVSASIGISLYPNDADNVDSLLKNADVAMYHAKELGRNNFQFYSKALNIAVAEKLDLENRLRRALRQGEFELHYQPLMRSGDTRLVGAEALIRWREQKQRLLFPNEFLAVAAESGLMAPIEDWVLTTACVQNKRWQDEVGTRFPVVVNLSGLHLRQRNLFNIVSKALAASKLEPQYLELDIAEKVLMKEIGFATAVFGNLSQLGVRLSINNFGTAYSSLLDLRRLPLAAIKIDPTLIGEIGSNRDYEAIVAAVIALAHQLGIKVVATGVESEAQRAFLAAHGCDEIQGYLISHPLPATEFAELLRAQPGALVATPAAG